MNVTEEAMNVKPQRGCRGGRLAAVLFALASSASGSVAARPTIPAGMAPVRILADTGTEAILESRLSQLENRINDLQQQIIVLQTSARAGQRPPTLLPAPTLLPTPMLPAPSVPAAPAALPDTLPTLPSRDAVLIQMGYDAGAGHATILRPPADWRADPRTAQSSRRVRSVTLHGRAAQVVVQQDERVTCTDPTGERHLVESVRAWQDEWRSTPQGWAFGRHILNGGGPDLIDGRAVAEGD